MEVMIESVISGDSLSNLVEPYPVIHFAKIRLKIDVEKILGPDYLTKDANGNSPIYESIQVQLVVDEASETTGLTEDGFRTEFEDFLKINLGLFRAEERRQLRSCNQSILLAGVPDDADFVKMIRYDALLFNQYQKRFKEL